MIRMSVESGRNKIEWVKKYMPVLCEIKKDFEKKQYFKGKKIAMSIHLEAKTAYLATILKAGGAEVTATGCNPLPTQDDVCEALREYGITVNAKHGVSMDEYFNDLRKTLSVKPDMIIDDGGDLTTLIHDEMPYLADTLYGATEETTTGVMRHRARAAEGKLLFPIVSVNDAFCKYLIDNRYDTGQSV